MTSLVLRMSSEQHLNRCMIHGSAKGNDGVPSRIDVIFSLTVDFHNMTKKALKCGSKDEWLMLSLHFRVLYNDVILKLRSDDARVNMRGRLAFHQLAVATAAAAAAGLHKIDATPRKSIATPGGGRPRSTSRLRPFADRWTRLFGSVCRRIIGRRLGGPWVGGSRAMVVAFPGAAAIARAPRTCWCLAAVRCPSMNQRQPVPTRVWAVPLPSDSMVPAVGRSGWIDLGTAYELSVTDWLHGTVRSLGTTRDFVTDISDAVAESKRLHTPSP